MRRKILRCVIDFLDIARLHAYARENVLLRRPWNIDAVDNKQLLNQHVRRIRTLLRSYNCRIAKRMIRSIGLRLTISTVYDVTLTKP